MKNFIKKIGKILIPFICILFLLLTITSNWQEVLIYFKDFQAIPLIVSFIVLLLIYPESAFAWYTLTRKLGVKIPLKGALYLWVISNTSRYIPGSIWQYVGRVELGQRMGIERKTGIVSVLYETILIAISGFLLSIFALDYWATVGIKPYMIILGISIPFILIHPAVLRRVFFILAKVSKKEQLILIPLNVWDYLLILPLFIANFLLNGLALIFLAYAFTGTLEIEKLFLFSGIYALSWMIGYFSIFAPGGIGVAEVVLALLLGMQFPLSLASTIAIIYRFLLIIAELLVFLLILKFRNSKA